MKARTLRVGLLVAVLIASLLMGPAVGALDPELEEDIETSVEAGLTWLLSQQQPDGSWLYGGGICDSVATTGLAVLKLATYAIELDMDPLDPGYPYYGPLSAGLGFIMANMHVQEIGVEPAGDPDADGDGIGVFFVDVCGWHPVYSTGIAMMAIAASGGTSNDAGLRDILQDAVDFMAWAQADIGCEPNRGGWRYGADSCDSDNSNSGYVTLGLGYAAAPPPWGFGLTVQQWVKDELSIWIDVMQDDVNGDPDDGGSWYDPWNPWVNILKTGNLIYEMGLVGDTAETPRVQDAIDYIERHWSDPGGCGAGWRDHRQAMFTMMKGLESMKIEFLDLDGDGVPEHEWFPEVAQHLIDTQNPDGSWTWDCWGDQVPSTAWALLTLEKAVPVFEIPVFVDIKPGSCPNPFNSKDKGVLPVAVLGTEDFDVTTIDPATIRLTREEVEEGVAPMRWSYEDVATPFEGELCDCHDLNGDGYLDLSLKFSVQEVNATLGLQGDAGNNVELTLVGNLLPDAGGTPIRGADCVRVLK